MTGQIARCRVGSTVVGQFLMIRRNIKGVDNLTAEQIGAEGYFRFADNPGLTGSVNTSAFVSTNFETSRLL
jgi:hypothetical protein